MQGFRLKNGLKILVKEDHRTAAVVSQLWYRVGGSHEPLGETGISHALEHMMFRGTPRYPGNAFSHSITAQGGRENAQTSRDYTFYYEEFAANALPLAFELEADRMCHLSLTAKDFAKEKEIILEERRLRVDDDPFSLMYEKFSAHAFSNTYRNPVIGSVQDIKNLTVKKLRRWYETWYTPNNATLVVVGDVDPQAVYYLAKNFFGAIPAGDVPTVLAGDPHPLPLSHGWERGVKEPHPLPLSHREIQVKMPAKLPWLLMGYPVPSLVTVRPKWHAYALEVAAAILSSGQSARLYRQLVREKQLATEADANYDLHDRLSGIFLMTAVPEKKVTIQQLKRGLLAQVQQLQEQSVSEEELTRVKNQVMARQIYKKDSMFGEASELGLLESIGLSWKLAEQHVVNIQAVTAAQIQAVARRYLQADRVMTGILVPN